MCRTWASLQCTTYADKIIVFYVLGANQGAHNTRRVRVYGLRPTRKRLQGQLELRPSSVVPRTQSTTDKFTSINIRGCDVCEVSRLPKSERSHAPFLHTHEVRNQEFAKQNNTHTQTVKCITKSYLIRPGEGRGRGGTDCAVHLHTPDCDARDGEGHMHWHRVWRG